MPVNLTSPTPSARPRPCMPRQPRLNPVSCHSASRPRQPGITGSPRKVAGEEPEVGADVELGDDMALAMLAAVGRDVGDPVHHQHRRRREAADCPGRTSRRARMSSDRPSRYCVGLPVIARGLPPVTSFVWRPSSIRPRRWARACAPRGLPPRARTAKSAIEISESRDDPIRRCRRPERETVQTARGTRAAHWLDRAGLRPTRQRLALAELLVGDGATATSPPKACHAAARAPASRYRSPPSTTRCAPSARPG